MGNKEKFFGVPAPLTKPNTRTATPGVQPRNLKTNELFDVRFEEDELVEGDGLVYDSTSKKFVTRQVAPVLSDSSDPTVNDDSYDLGTIWINLLTPAVFILVDNTPTSAVWKQISFVP